MSWTYSVDLAPSPDGITGTVPELPGNVATGLTVGEVMDGLRERVADAVRTRIREGEPLPPPASVPGPGVTLPAQLAAKATVYSLWRASGLTKSALAARMGRDEAEVRRILDPEHSTKIAQIEEAVAAMGARLDVSASVEAPPDAGRPIPRSGRVVREIPWQEERDDGRDYLHANTPCGVYQAWYAHGRGFWTHQGAQGRIEAGRSLAEAKAAAQDHFDRQVRGALEPWVADALRGATES